MRIITETKHIDFADWLARKLHDGDIESDWSNWYMDTREGHHLFGRRVLIDTDYEGTRVLKFDTPTEAEQWMCDNILPDEYDAFISYDQYGVSVYCAGIDGIHRGVTLPTFRRAVAALRLAMHRSGVYPTVWIQGEHGPSQRLARMPLTENS